ncbi:SH3 domain-containing protein [Rhodobacterales bacterium]|nr:SH3 domain-containing protein [Rhodobacterales bacterium]
MQVNCIAYLCMWPTGKTSRIRELGQLRLPRRHSRLGYKPGECTMRSLIERTLSATNNLLMRLGAVTQSHAVITDGITVIDQNLRAGPGRQFPVVTIIPNNAKVLIYGCTDDAAWCDVGFGENRGWVASQDLEVTYHNRQVYLTPATARSIGLVTVPFGLTYWNAHYVGRSWHGSWSACFRPLARGTRGRRNGGTRSAKTIPEAPRGAVMRRGSIGRI